MVHPSRRSSNGSPGDYGSITASDHEMCDDRMQDPQNDDDMETRTEYRDRWISIGIVIFIQFLLMLQNSILWNSLWPFLSTIDPSADETFLGFVMMSFSLAGAISSPFFGWWTNRIHQTKLPIVAGILISIVGNLLVAFVESFPYHRKWVLLVARFITGLGCGNYAPLFAYVVMASKVSERSRAISIRASLNSVALLAGPALQAAFVPIGFPGFVSEWFHFDMYTATAWTSVGACLIQLTVISTMFHEYWISVDKSELKKDADGLENGQSSPIKTLRPYNRWAALACIWIRFAFQFSLMFDGTISSPFTMLMFGWTASQAVLYNGIIQIFTSVVDFFGNLLMGHVVLKYVQERKVIIVGLISAALFFAINFSWPGLPPLVEENDTPQQSSNQLLLSNGSLLNNSSNVTLTEAIASQLTTVGSVCSYNWCKYTTRVYFWQYLVAKVCFVLSISIGYTPNATLFSKIVGPRKQGTLQGAFEMAGQFAMTAAPLLSGIVWQASGPRATYIIGCSIILSAIITSAILYSKLVPWKNYDISEKINNNDTTEETNPLLGNNSE